MLYDIYVHYYAINSCEEDRSILSMWGLENAITFADRALEAENVKLIWIVDGLTGEILSEIEKV